MALQDYQIALGYNNAAGFTNIEDLTPSGSTAFRVADKYVHYFVKGIGNFDIPYIATAMGVSQNGAPLLPWMMTQVSTIAWTRLRTTYGQDSAQKGKVTIRTRLGDDEQYVNRNAILTVPVKPDAEIANYGGVLFWVNESGFSLQLQIVGVPS